MKKHLMVLATAVVMGMSLVSCSAIGVVGAVYTGTTVPHSVTDNKLGTKVGSVKCTSILGIAAYGDAGINTAAKMAGIKKVSHVDVKTFSVLGLFTTQTYFVYGE
jgi:hypothetical protein